MMLSKKMRALAAVMALTMAAGVLGGCGGDKKEETAAKKTANVGIVQLVEHASLDAANKGFVDGLAANGFKEGENITFDKHNAQADQSNLQNIAHRFVSNKVDLICAIATPAAQTCANATKDIPIVATAVTDYEAAKLVAKNDKPGGNVTGTSDMNPIKEQLDLLLKLVPDAKVVGTIYSSSEVNSQMQVDLLKKYAAERGVEIKEATVSSVNDIQQAAQSIIGDIDCLYLPTDNVMASAVPTLISVTEPAKLVMTCGWPDTEGSVAVIGIDYYELGKQTGEMAAKILKGEAKPADMAVETQKQFKVTINKAVADRLGYTIPEEVLKEAEAK